MARTPETLELEGLTVTTAPLPYEKAEDIKPDVMVIVAKMVEAANGVITPESLAALKQDKSLIQLLFMFGPLVGALGAELGGGKLKRLVPLLLASTTVEMADETGTRSRYDLVKLSDRASVFDEKPEAYWPVLLFAGKVSFARFFSAGALLARGERAPT